MLHKALSLKLLQGTKLEVTFSTGEVKQYDVSLLFSKYPQLKQLKDRKLFLKGKLLGQYGIVWNGELDLEVETIYEDGKLVGHKDVELTNQIGNLILEARDKAGLSQKELSNKCGIDQSDISKLERGVLNPSIGLLERVFNALDCKLVIDYKKK